MTRKQRTTSDLKAFSELRSSAIFMSPIYSFLPLRDLFRLGEVDKEFLEEEQRSRIVGTYGDRNMDIERALKEDREYVEFIGTPDSVGGCLSNELMFWFWICEGGKGADNVNDKIQPNWFSTSSDFNLKVIAESKKCDAVEIMGFEQVSLGREMNREALAKISEDVDRSLPFPRYNLLFELMEKYGLDPYPFLTAEDPPIDGFSEDAYKIRSGDSGSCILHLMPSRKITYRGGDGKLVKKVIENYETCRKFKNDVQGERFGRKH